jgi:hypothetical protein
VSVINVIDASELIRYLHEVNICLVFIDCTTVNVNDAFMNYLQSYKGCGDPIIIYIDNEKNFNNYKNLNERKYVFSNVNIIDQLRKIHYKLSCSNLSYKQINYNITEIYSYLTNYLINIGFAPKHSGFTFIKQAIDLSLKNDGQIGSLSREIYPKIATNNKTLPQNVERNIRNAIECACKTSDFSSDPIKHLMYKNKISNRAFLCYLLDKVINNYGTIK